MSQATDLESELYKKVKRKPLTFKKKGAVGDAKKKKKKKKSRKRKRESVEATDSSQKDEFAIDVESGSPKKRKIEVRKGEMGDTQSGEVRKFKSEYELALEKLTPSEKAFLERQRKNEEQMMDKMTALTHRQKIEQFNQRLASTSEHYDIPKVGPG